MCFKGKGAGKGKSLAAPRPAPKSLGAPSKSAAGGFAPKRNKVDGTMVVHLCIRTQISDGSFPPEALVRSASQYQTPDIRETLQLLLEKDIAFCTATMVHIVHLYYEKSPLFKEKQEIITTRMDNGRGEGWQGEVKTTKKSFDDAIAMLSAHSPLGTKWFAQAEAWLAANATASEQEIAGAWVADHVSFPDTTANSKKVISDEDRQKKEELMRQKEMEQRDKMQACEAHWRSLEGSSTVDVPWASCKQTMHVGGGTGGCLLVELDESAAICIKPQKMHAVSEFIAERVLKVLNIPVASCRPVAGKSEEYQAIVSLLTSAPTMIEGHEISRRAMLGDAEFFGVLEFVPGHGLMGMEAHDALAGQDALDIYKALGRLCAADVVINNLDRMPLPIWGNDGNLSNIMLKSGKEVVAIDQQVNVIVEGPGREAYLAKLRNLVADSRCGASSKAAASVKQSLAENTGTDASAEAMDAMMAELCLSFEHVAQLWSSGAFEEAISQAVFEAMVCFDQTSKDLGQSRLEVMSDFVRGTAAAVAQAVSETAS